MRFGAALLRPSVAPAAITLVVMCAITWFAVEQNQAVYHQRMRADVLKEMSVVRAKLEGNITADIQLVRGLVTVIANEPDMQQARFARLAGKLLGEHSHIRNIAGAPDMVVSLMYPLEGNERAIGLDYRNNEAQREATMRARQTGQMVLAGPVELVQGGRGFIGRFPVFTGEARQPRFWGVVSAVIDEARLFEASGLTDPALDIEIAISGRDGLGNLGGQFYGSPAVLDGQPLTASVVLPSGEWIISAIPRGGWPAVAPNSWIIWISYLALTVLLTAPVFFAGQLMEERHRNLSALSSREGELRRLSRRLGLALESSQVGVFEYDLETRELLWDDRVNAVFGLPRDGGTRHYEDWSSTLHPQDRRQAEDEFREAVEVTGRYYSEYRIVTPQGVVRNVRAIGTVYKDAGSTAKIVGVNWDVSADVALNDALKRVNRLSEMRYAELESAKAAIEHNALHDSLTGLPNRRYLDEVLRARAEHPGGILALLHVDLDRFKQINDTLGHAAGDALLVHASKVLHASTRKGDIVARIGGDEFVVVVTNTTDEAYLSTLARRIITLMQQPVEYEGHLCRFGVSIGIALAEGRAIDTAKLLVNADIALYRAKALGRNRHEFFTEALQAEIISNKRIADDILAGIENNEFVPYYQPQIDAGTLKLAGAEALIRWNHPRDGLLAPDRFLKIAEDLNVMATLDRIVLEKALLDCARWAAKGLVMPKISVNVSARRLRDESLVESLTGLSILPGQISFELVESIFLDESDDVVLDNLERIKALGIDIEIDDFGTGHTSIVSLLKLKPKRLKIDRQLVAPILSSRNEQALVRSIIEIGRSLGIEIVAEGVETMAHAEMLGLLGCDLLQGYAFARPLSRDAFLAFGREMRWKMAS